MTTLNTNDVVKDVFRHAASKKIYKTHRVFFAIAFGCGIFGWINYFTNFSSKELMTGVMVIASLCLGAGLGAWVSYYEKIRQRKRMKQLSQSYEESHALDPEKSSLDRVYSVALSEVEDVLSDFLTPKGIEQWLTTPHSALKGNTPDAELQEGNYKQVLQLAHSFVSGSNR